MTISPRPWRVDPDLPLDDKGVGFLYDAAGEIVLTSSNHDDLRFVLAAVNGTDPASPYLRQETLSAKDRAFKITVDALEKLSRQWRGSETGRMIDDELARVRTLVPEVG